MTITVLAIIGLVAIIAAISVVVVLGVFRMIENDHDILAAVILCVGFALVIFVPVGLFATVEDITSKSTSRTITIYTADGDVMAQYDGDISDVSYDDCRIKFDYEDKEYFYQNCFVEMIEED